MYRYKYDAIARMKLYCPGRLLHSAVNLFHVWEGKPLFCGLKISVRSVCELDSAT